MIYHLMESSLKLHRFANIKGNHAFQSVRIRKSDSLMMAKKYTENDYFCPIARKNLGSVPDSGTVVWLQDLKVIKP